MSIKSIFSDIWHYLEHTFDFLKKDADKVAIAVTQDINMALNSGLTDDIVKILEQIPGVGKLPESVLAVIKPFIPKLLAFELGLQAIPDSTSTPEQVGIFAQEVAGAWGSASLYKKTKIYTTVAAEVYNETMAYLKQDGKLTFFDVVKIIQDAFNAWTLAKAQNPDTTSMDALASPLRTNTGIPTGPAKSIIND